MIIAGYDTETTGLDALKGHKIIEVCAQLWKQDDATGAWERKINYVQRISPMRSIDAAAQAVHHIALSDLVGCPEFAAVAPTLVKILSRADLIVAHNGIWFDGPFTNEELRQASLPPLKKPWLDTMTEGKWATANGKNPTLGELCFACDVPYDPTKAHAADVDVDCMMAAALKGIEWGYFDLTKTVVV